METSCDFNSELLRKSTICLDWFKFKSVLGMGGYGTVIKILDQRKEHKGMFRAAKIQRLDMEDNMETCFREINYLRNANKKYFPALYLAFEVTGVKHGRFSVIIMELCEGSLRNAVFKKSALADLVKKWIILRIAEALEYLHVICRVINGDIKPDNVLFSEGYFPVMCDLGLMKDIPADTEEIWVENPQGTPRYSAPECFNENKFSAKSDMWAFGCLAFFVWTTKDVFQKKTDIPKLTGDEKKLNEFIHDRLQQASLSEEERLLLQKLLKTKEDRCGSLRTIANDNLFQTVKQIDDEEYSEYATSVISFKTSTFPIADEEIKSIFKGKNVSNTSDDLYYDSSVHGVSSCRRGRNGRFLRKRPSSLLKRSNEEKKRKHSSMNSKKYVMRSQNRSQSDYSR